MTEAPPLSLLVIGAGPKAIAVAAKAQAMRALGLVAPRVIAVEHRGVASNWLPAGGWTNGRHRLGTSPEKDLGFPYRSTISSEHDIDINANMLRYSWHSYLATEHRLAEWVDRGRPAPTHADWAAYLRWAAERSELELVTGEVEAIDVRDSGWTLRCRGGQTVIGDALMVTGPGPSTHTMLPSHPCALSTADFWRAAQTPLVARQVAVIGGGETAASIAGELAQHRDIHGILIVSPSAALFTRGESYFENSAYSDPTGWPELPVDERLELIHRTDHGVFSLQAQQALAQDNRIRHLCGRLNYATAVGEQLDITIERMGTGTVRRTFDLVIDATGGDLLWFLDLFTHEATNRLETVIGGLCTADAISACLGCDLAPRAMTPKLFLPNLSGLSQGPGFPNLSCLGVLSDRVVGALYSGASRSLSGHVHRVLPSPIPTKEAHHDVSNKPVHRRHGSSSSDIDTYRRAGIRNTPRTEQKPAHQ